MQEKQNNPDSGQPSEHVNSSEHRNSLVQKQDTRQVPYTNILVQCKASIRTWKTHKPDPIAFEKKAHFYVTSQNTGRENAPPEEAMSPITIELPDHVTKKPLNFVDKVYDPEISSTILPPSSAQQQHQQQHLALLDRNHSYDTSSTTSRCQLTRTSKTTHRGGKLTITPAEHRSRLVLEETSSHSSTATGTTDKSSYSSHFGRPSLSWNKRVSINTPRRRESEHEVGWIEPDEIKTSSSSEDYDNEDTLILDMSRRSIVVNMDAATGNRVSISLAKLDEDIKEYLTKESEGLYST